MPSQFDLAITHRRNGDYNAALSLLQSKEPDPDQRAEHRCEMAINLSFLGKHRDAIPLYKEAIALKPDYLAAVVNLGVCHNEVGDHQAAVACYERALRIDPHTAVCWGNMAKALHDAGEHERSIYCYLRALDHHRSPHYLRGLALAWRQAGRLHRAHPLLMEALALNPNDERAHMGLAINHLLAGNASGALEEFEWRLKLPPHQALIAEYPSLNQKSSYQGEDLTGKTLLVWAEQDLGETIQYSRFLPLAQAAAKVVLWCQPEVRRLLKANFSLDSVADDPSNLPDHDYQITLQSLPRYFDPNLASLQRFTPYLAPAKGEKVVCKKVVKAKNIGFCWAPLPFASDNLSPRIPLQQLTPLLDQPGIAWHSLQMGKETDELKQFSSSHAINDLSGKLQDVASLARAIKELDLVITADSTVADLAGAMGKPVWLMLPKNPQWRWQGDYNKSLWYPTITTFAQATNGDWSTAIRHMHLHLSRMIQA